ncbi:MAG: phosphotransferase, partial [Thermoleophilaceae bacterium]
LAPLARVCLAAARRGGGQPWSWRWLPSHRDFYPQHVLVDRGRIGFLDLDDAAASEPALDLANFLAHLRLERLRTPDAERALRACARSFLRAYRGRDPELDPALVRFLEGTTLLRLAHIHPPFAASLLAESQRCLLNTAG